MPDGFPDPRPLRRLLLPMLALLPLFACVAGPVLELRAAEAARSAERLRDAGERATLAVAAELSADLRELETLGASAALARSDLPAFREEARRLLARHADWFTIALIGAEGQRLNLRHPAEATPSDPGLPAGLVGLGTRAEARELADGRVLLAVPVAQEGAVRGVLTAELEPSALGRLLARARLPQGWSALLLDGLGRQLAATGPAPPAAVAAALAAPGRMHSSVAGASAIAADLSGTGWHVVVVAPQAAAGAPLAWLGGGLLAALLAAFILRRGAAACPAPAAETGVAALVEELRAPLDALLASGDLRAGELLAAQLADLAGTPLPAQDSELDLPALLEGVAAPMRPLALRRGLSLAVVVEPGLPRPFHGDSLRLRQVVTQLLGAALGAAREGRVTLRARLLPCEAQVEIAVAVPGDAVPGEVLPGLFARFRPGAGLAARLAGAMGGAVALESQPGEGTRFVLRLPCRPPAGERPERRLRLLLAEDVPASRLLLETLLRRAGHDVTAVADGAAALAALHGESYTAALLDLQMPGVDGLAAAAAIRRMPGPAGRLPLIALTADPGEAVETGCRAAGFDAVLRKPVQAARLVALVEALAARPDGTGRRLESRTGA